MAKRCKYGLDKRLKELKKKKKRDEKLERKRLKKQGAQNDSEESREAPLEATHEGFAPDGESKEREDQ
ncbi:MAG: hypothetical protein GTO51_04910 [Candidatus Latescibacteria bacterium]|nr:hypothetical protein [Candidatus Latescibacterota bacterium]NIO28343.1 hypothetical protein [Candidatus Latescibacterota bacterium]NIO55890.1 hypothetical protein [Candidatus Latescibacterota bacterium]NIT01856.1 hypothetical protein [Candidatus Latescibacterota bacterium]